MRPTGDVELPEDDRARDLMEFCSIADGDRRAMLAARLSPIRDPDWWALLRGAAGELCLRMDRPLDPAGYATWPTVPESAGPVGMFLYAWALLAVVPTLLEAHRARGIEPEMSREAVQGLGGVMTSHLEVTGRRGVGLFPLWGPPQSFCGLDFTLGRHTFTRATMAWGDGPAGYVLHVHIPPTGALDRDRSERSIQDALAFFARHFADEPLAAIVCRSWVLDPQLQRMLRPDSNIVRFQESWNLLPRIPLDDLWEGDRELLRLGLQVRTPDAGPLTEEYLVRVPRETSLQRGFVDHLRTGGHWYKRDGIR